MGLFYVLSFTSFFVPHTLECIFTLCDAVLSLILHMF